MTQSAPCISVIGAGAWGTALAQVWAHEGRSVTLYARHPELAEAIRQTRSNDTYLSGIALDARLSVTSDLSVALATADIVVLATPAQHVRTALLALNAHLPAGVPLINAAKGIEIASGKLLSEVVSECAQGHPYAALSGPTFAHEVARGLPTAITLASSHPHARLWAETLRAKSFRPYLSDDAVGVDLAGALKNVIAIACGVVEGKALGQNAKSAVMTRGMAEIRRLGVRKGAISETFLGLAGIGDLTLTCHSMSSRNFSLGFELGKGRSLQDILAGRKTVAEGVSTAQAVAVHAQELGVDMPICLAVHDLLQGRASAETLIAALLSRDLKSETL